MKQANVQVFLCCLKQEWEVSLFYPCAPLHPVRIRPDEVVHVVVNMV